MTMAEDTWTTMGWAERVRANSARALAEAVASDAAASARAVARGRVGGITSEQRLVRSVMADVARETARPAIQSAVQVSAARRAYVCGDCARCGTPRTCCDCAERGLRPL